MSPVEVTFNYAQDPGWLLVFTLLTYVGWPVFNALCDLAGMVGRLRHRRHVRRLNDASEAYGVGYRAGSPPSHAVRAPVSTRAADSVPD